MESTKSPILSLGVQFMLLSAMGFSLMTACVKAASTHGIPFVEIVAARALVSLIISYADVRRKGISIWGNNKKLLFARGAFGTASLMCVYYAVTTLPLAEATILQYVHPVFTGILAIIFLKERMQYSTMICIVLCMVGLFAMLQPDLHHSASTNLPLFNVGVALCGAFGSAVAYVIVKKLSRSEDSSVIIFYFPLVALPVSALFAGHHFIWPDWPLIILLVFVGIFTQIGQYGLTKAMQTEAAGRASAFSYIQIVFSMLIGAFIFHEIPSVWTYLGGALIVSGALINVFGHHLPGMRRRVTQ